jgi:lysophospholipase L1-like esterase
MMQMMRMGRRHIAGVVLAGALASCSSPTSTVPAQPSTVVLGDSISEFSRAEIVDALGGDGQVDVLAQVGRTFNTSQGAADSVADQRPSVVVVELGTNDVWSGTPLEEVTRELDAMLAKFPSSCIVVVTLNEAAVDARSLVGRLYDNAAAMALNAELRERADEVVEWSQAANADRITYLDQGTIHPTERGRQLLADLMKAAADRCAT